MRITARSGSTVPAGTLTPALLQEFSQSGANFWVCEESELERADMRAWVEEHLREVDRCESGTARLYDLTGASTPARQLEQDG